jgi:hypothetical protein
MTFSTDEAFAQFAAHRQAERGQTRQAVETQEEVRAPRRLTEGEKVNLPPRSSFAPLLALPSWVWQPLSSGLVSLTK